MHIRVDIHLVELLVEVAVRGLLEGRQALVVETHALGDSLLVVN